MKTFFTHAKYTYSYFKSAEFSRLKLRVSRKQLEEFRTSIGRSLEMYVDIYSQGSGWYEITAKEDLKLNKLFGTFTDGLAVWLREWNRFHLSIENANPQPYTVKRVKRISFDIQPPAKEKLRDLQQRWRFAPHRTHALV